MRYREDVSSRRDRITKGAYMTMDSPIATRMNASSPRQQQQPSPFAAVGRQIDAAREKLEQIAATLRAAKQS
jgi:hypothetical protein